MGHEFSAVLLVLLLVVQMVLYYQTNARYNRVISMMLEFRRNEQEICKVENEAVAQRVEDKMRDSTRHLGSTNEP